MAITKIRYIGENAQSTGKHLHTVIRYVTNAKKTEGGRYIGTRNCLPDTVYEDMVDKKDIIENKSKAIKQAYSGISRAVSVKIENNQELKMTGARIAA